MFQVSNKGTQKSIRFASKFEEKIPLPCQIGFVYCYFFVFINFTIYDFIDN